MEVSKTLRLASGDEIPRVGLGTWQMRPEVTREAVRSALAAGYRHIDTARVYGNEPDVGEAIADAGVPRAELWITTKIWNTDQGFEATLKAGHESLRRLRVEQIDLLLIHWPVPDKRIDTWRALVKLQKDGIARCIGVSNFDVHHLEDLARHSEVRPVINQIEMHPFLPQAEIRAWCEARGVAVAAYSPLTRGERLQHRAIIEVSARTGLSPAQVLLRWGLEKGAVVLPKSAHADRIAANLDVFDVELDAHDLAHLDTLDEGLRTCWDPTDVP